MPQSIGNDPNPKTCEAQRLNLKTEKVRTDFPKKAISVHKIVEIQGQGSDPDSYNIYIYTPILSKLLTAKSKKSLFSKVLLSRRSLDSPYTPAMITRPKYRLGLDKFKFW